MEAAKEVRWARIQDSMARNPTFDFTTPRFDTAYAESAFPYRFMVDGRSNNGSLDLDVARGFFQYGRFPPDFHRRNGSFGSTDLDIDAGAIGAAHPINPGRNNGAGNYTVDTTNSNVRPGLLAA